MKDRIFALMEKLQLSPAKFADAIGINRSTISGIKSGRTQPTLQLLEKLHNAYPEVNVYWLLYGVGEVFNSQVGHSSMSFDNRTSSNGDNKIINAQLLDNDNIANDAISLQETEILSTEKQTVTSKEKFSCKGTVGISHFEDNQRQTKPLEDNGHVPSQTQHLPSSIQHDRKIIRVVTFFSDGTYEQFVPE
ncbi:MAG: helix-turn-helix domain-containing protein [Candidatus Aphodosoma sp.]